MCKLASQCSGLQVVKKTNQRKSRAADECLMSDSHAGRREDFPGEMRGHLNNSALQSLWLHSNPVADTCREGFGNESTVGLFTRHFHFHCGILENLAAPRRARDLVLKCLMQPQIFQVALVLSSVVEGVLSNSSLSTAVTWTKHWRYNKRESALAA